MFNLKPTTKCRVSESPFNNILHYWEQGNFLEVLFQRGMSTTQVFVDYSNIFMEWLRGLKSKVLKEGSIKKEQNMTISDQQTRICYTEKILSTITQDWQKAVPKYNCSHQNIPRCIFLFETYICLQCMTGNSGQAPLLEVF